jgi:hypothetical protein
LWPVDTPGGSAREHGEGPRGIALLVPLPDEAVDEILSANAVRLAACNRLIVPALVRMLKRSRQLGYASILRAEVQLIESAMREATRP